MQTKDITTGTDYAVSIGGRVSLTDAFDNPWMARRARVLDTPKGGKVRVRTKNGEEIVSTSHLISTWAEWAERAQQGRQWRADAEKNSIRIAEERNEARAWLAETLGSDWAEGLGFGIDEEAELVEGRYGKVTHGGTGEVTAVALKALVEKAMQIAKMA